ncbi:MAG: ribose-5-phosphate isomerase A, partial [Conexibacter sp.]
LGLPLADLDTIERIDLLVDGADQVAPDLTMIKGRGGALTREKKLAAIAAQRIYAIDSEKQVPVLGNTWLPVEVLPYGWRFTLRITALMFVTMVLAALAIDLLFSALGLIPTARPSTEDVFGTIELNYKAVLNVLATAVFLALMALTRRRAAVPAHAH